MGIVAPPLAARWTPGRAPCWLCSTRLQNKTTVKSYHFPDVARIGYGAPDGATPSDFAPCWRREVRPLGKKKKKNKKKKNPQCHNGIVNCLLTSQLIEQKRSRRPGLKVRHADRERRAVRNRIPRWWLVTRSRFQSMREECSASQSRI